jgi:hypothetical protein
MNRFTIIGIVIIALFLESCEPAAIFDQPQPVYINPLTSFPGRLQGKYLSVDQASIVTIEDKLLTRTFDFDVQEHKDSISSSYILKGDTITDQTNGTKEKVLLKGDYVIKHVHWIDTLFNISEDNVLKKLKGYYFLNIRYSDSAWEVIKLSLKDGVLTVGSVSVEEDLQKLEKITETSSDTLPSRFTLKRKQFKKFIRQEGFSEQETFTRIKEKDK